AERVAEADESGRLHRGVDVDGTRQELRLVADDPDHVTAQPAEPDDDVLGEERLYLEELAVVEDPRHHLAHVVGLVRSRGHDRLKLGIRTLVVVGGRDERGPLIVARRQIRQQPADAGRAILLGLGQEVRDARGGVVHVTAAQLVKGHGLTGDDPDYLRAGDEHVALARDDEDEVGYRRSVDGATRARTGDDADLRDDAR